MYLWKIDPLIDDLKHNNITQKEQLKYAAAFSVLTLILSDPLLLLGWEYGSIDAVASLIYIVITVALTATLEALF